MLVLLLIVFFVEGENGEVDYIEAHGVIWKYKLPETAMEVMRRFEEGELLFSMETWYKTVECPLCNESFSAREDASGNSCSHLQTRFMNEEVYSDNFNPNEAKVYRILRDLVLAGAAITMNPADEDADALLAAARRDIAGHEKINNESEGVQDLKTQENGNVIFENMEDFNDTVQKAVDKAVTAAIEKSESASKMKELEDEIERVKTEATDALRLRDEAINEKETVETAFANFKTEIEQKEKVSSRLSELDNAGYEIDSENSDSVEKMVASFDDDQFSFFLESVRADSPDDDDNTYEDEDDDDDEEAEAEAEAIASKNKNKNKRIVSKLTKNVNDDNDNDSTDDKPRSLKELITRATKAPKTRNY
jgi:hypothetical protein